MKINLKENKNGITLIALIVTIIVLLILAGVSIRTLTGENGILIKTKVAKEKYDESVEKEKNKLDEMANLSDSIVDTKEIENNSINKINPNKLSNSIILQTGVENASTTQKTTDYIKAKTGDELYFYASRKVGGSLSRTTITFIMYYDKNQNFISRSQQFISTPAKIDVENVEYIRITYSINCTEAILTVNINKLPEPVKYVDYPYFDGTSGKTSSEDVIKYNIDCWGDSLTENGSAGDSYPTILQNMLGNKYKVKNYGQSSQTSGMIALRFGSNDVYITLENDKIPEDTSEVTIKEINCSTGTSRNFFNLSDTRPLRCSINGVDGILNRNGLSKQTFKRNESGSEVNVSPNTEIVVEENQTDAHTCIIWIGKNDISVSAEYTVSGIVSNVKGMVNKLKHNRFIIIPVTPSTTDNYKNGTEIRNKINTIRDELKAMYPNNVLDITDLLINNGLSDANIVATEVDNQNISDGLIPSSLMADDKIHTNLNGKKLEAKYIYQFMKNKSWVD